MLMTVWVALLTLGLTSCSDDDKLPVVVPSATGTMQDNDGNEYHWVRIGNLDWMTENLHCGTPLYDDLDNDRWGNYYSLSWKGDRESLIEHYNRFGNYYSWQEAMDNAPEGWRLPTDEDWKNLEMALGMSKSEADKDGWRNGASQLMTQSTDGTGLDFRYGGQVCYFSWSVTGYHDYDYGYYWTGTRDDVNDEPASYARAITPSKNAVNRIHVLHEQHFLSVRYVRDAK